MKPLNSVVELEDLRKKILSQRSPDKPSIIICASTGCRAYGSENVINAFNKEIENQGVSDRVDLKVTGCHGFCERGPLVVISPKRVLYQRVSPEDVSEIISETILKDKIIERLLYTDPSTEKEIPLEEDINFYKWQQRVVFANNGLIDPTDIGDYIAIGGYSALSRVIVEMSPIEVIEEVKKSGLRGRGGGGFPTGLKWELLAKQPNGRGRVVICNGDEGDPGAYMDRSVLEGNPHSVIEGMLIGAYSTGATEGIIYVRNEYPLAVKHILIALEQAHDLGLLGEKILGSDLSFDIRVVRGAGAFVCGEETALMKSVEGTIGEPSQRPPFPVEVGVYGKPTAINNVETWANVSIVIGKGGGEYAKTGTQKSTGTKIFSLVGKIRNTGLVEVPMGVTFEDIVYRIGGGPVSKAKIKAVQIGGPSGGCIPSGKFDLIIDYDSLTEAGAMMGSGGLVVMDENTCMVDVARYFLAFTNDESCGKCTPCREGTRQMLKILTRITEGQGWPGDIERLETLGRAVKDASLCGLGGTAPNPVLTTIRYFRDEYEAHIKYKRCPAVVCKEIISAPCHHICPIGTDVPSFVAYIAQRKFDEALRVIYEASPFASICGRVCHHPCEFKCTCGQAGDPISVRALRRFVVDRARKKHLRPFKKFAKKYDEKVAIIGSGPAGLSCAYDLAKMGYRVTIFEALPVAGGMLYAGIPAHRLPRDVLNWEIDMVRKAGVEIRMNTKIGEKITFADLQKEYKAIFTATGAPKGLKLNIPGEDAEGVQDAIDFLWEFNLSGSVKVGKRVGVIGGGNAAVDAARIALRAGAEEVNIIYRRTKAEMPADEYEIEAAVEEGIKMHFLAAPTKAIVDQGRIVALECIRMELGKVDQSGRRHPVPQEGTEFTVELDMLIPAIGQEPDISYLPPSLDFGISRWKTVEVNRETLETGIPGVFAGGDLVTGPNTVTDAMGHGKRAAESIHKYLRGEKLLPTYEVTRPTTRIEPLKLTEEEMERLVSRPEMPSLQAEERIKSLAEVELGLDEAQAVNEAKRCLRCDWHANPENVGSET